MKQIWSCILGQNTGLIVALLGFLIASPSVARDLPFFAPKAPRIFESPDGLFRVELPNKWQVVALKLGESAKLTPAGSRPETQFVLTRIDVPKGAHPRLLRLKAIENRLGKLPGFKELAKNDAIVGGFAAASITATYHYQGNIQYPRVVEEVFVVAGNEAFILHFECFEPDGSAYARAVGKMYESLEFRINREKEPAGSAGHKHKAGAEPKKEQAPFVDRIPY